MNIICDDFLAEEAESGTWFLVVNRSILNSQNFQFICQFCGYGCAEILVLEAVLP